MHSKWRKRGSIQSPRELRIFLAVLAIFPFLENASLAYIDEDKPPVAAFSAYKPTYFLLGKKDGKGQISFKARLAEGIPLYLGYSQLMMWDIFNSSAPMRDINFNPEMFYRFQLGPDERPRWLDFGIFEHESNGLNGNDSRSWNRSSLRFNDMIQLSETHRLHLSVKLWVAYRCEGADCGRYRGIGELAVTLESPFGSSLGENDITLRVYSGGLTKSARLWAGRSLRSECVLAEKPTYRFS